MKLTTLTNVLRNKVTRGAAIAALAGAALAATPAAQAQRVSFGVSVGTPYYAPAPAVVYGGPAYGYGYWDGYHTWHRDYDRDRFYAHRDGDRFYRRDFDDRRHDRDDHRGGWGR